MSIFIERLTLLSKEKGTTRKELCKYLGIGINQIKRWEDSGAVPNPCILAAIAEYFGVSVDYLLGKSEQKEKPSEEGENVVIVSRNGERLEHRLNPEQIKLLEDMIKQFGGESK